MLLRLVYHQQQAIQVQLNTMTEWMQQITYKLSHLERSSHNLPSAAVAREVSRPPSVVGERPTAPATSGAVQPPSPASRHEGLVEAGSLARAAGSGATSVVATTPRDSQQLSALVEGSQACTPPSVSMRQSSVSNVGSAIRSYGSAAAAAAPWDPSSTSHLSTSTTQHHRKSFSVSSYGSQLGRRANPLLTSSAKGSKLPYSASLSQSSIQESRGMSRVDPMASGGNMDGGRAASQEGSLHRQVPIVSPPASAGLNYGAGNSYRVEGVPPYRRVPLDSRLSSTQRAAVTGEGHSTDTATRQPTAPTATATSATATGPSTAVDISAKQEGGAKDHRYEGPSERLSWSRTHVSPSATANRRTVMDDDDTLSDGYGSYESRMYMKNLGLL